MAQLTLIAQPVIQVTAQAYAFFLEHNYDFAHLQPFIQKFSTPIDTIAKQRGFTGKAGDSLVVSAVFEGQAIVVLLFGVGDLTQGSRAVEQFRRAVGRLVRVIEQYKLETIALEIPDPVQLNISYERIGQELATVAYQASYHFDEFITDATRKFHRDFTLILSAPAQEQVQIQVQEGINKGIAIGVAINQARYWCDLPPSVLTPAELARQAHDHAKEHNLEITIFDETALEALGMGGITGVSRGSEQEACLVILEYKTEHPNAPTIALVGKGVTFDSGGLSIKPAVSMETMKDDMAGAAVVLGVMQVIGQLKPTVNVVALAPLAENMPSGSALHPGDILKFYNGKTAEIKNTDAEGRLLLADALSYAVEHYKPDIIIDIATLTGACAHALGPFYAGVMGNNMHLLDKLFVASASSGDKIWHLPLEDDYEVAIKSDVADMSNIGNPKYFAGAITAALFLRHFVGTTAWAHLDIAGTAFGVPDLSYFRPGATGFGIRLLTDLIMHWA